MTPVPDGAEPPRQPAEGGAWFPVIAPRPRPRSLVNRTTVIVAALAAVVVGASAAGAATLLGSGEPRTPAAGSAASGGASAGGLARSVGGLGGANRAGAESISLSATGDIVMGIAPNRLPSNNGRGFFDQVRPLLAADLQMGNLEQVLTDDTGVGKCAVEKAGQTCFAFRTPPQFAQSLREGGFQLLNLANNHAYDFGPSGYRNTQKALDAAGIKYTGWPGMITVTEVRGLRVAVLGFASYSWSNLCSDLAGATKTVKDAAEQADLVVVQVHMGAEGADRNRVKPGTEQFLGENRCDPIKFAHTVVDAGADLVIGHGPHVVRAMEFYRGRLIAYSLGNFAGYRALSYGGAVGVTAAVRVTLRRDGSWVGGTLIPTRMVAPGLPRPDPKRQAITTVAGLTKQDFPRTGPTIAPDGTITARSG